MESTTSDASPPRLKNTGGLPLLGMVPRQSLGWSPASIWVGRLAGDARSQRFKVPVA